MGLYQSQVHEQKPMTSATNTTLQIPTGGKLQSVALVFYTSGGVPVTEAQIRAEIGNIRLTLNGKDVVNAPVNQILDCYEAMSVHVGTPAAVAGVVELNLGRLLFTAPELKDLVGFGTADVSSVQVQITAGTLSAIASVKCVTQRSPVNENLGMYCKFINYPVNFNSTGDHTMDTLPRDANSSYLLTMIDDGASGTITFGECRIGPVTVTERQDSALSSLFASNKGFAQPAGYFCHWFADASLAGRLPMQGVTDLRFITTFSVAPGAAGYNITPLTLIVPDNMKL